MPRVAALLGVNQVSDVMSIEGEYIFKRPIYAGNAVVTVEAPADRIVVATIRPASYREVGATAEKDVGVALRAAHGGGMLPEVGEQCSAAGLRNNFV